MKASKKLTSKSGITIPKQLRIDTGFQPGMSAYQARRLIRTENSQVSSKANLLGYEENEIGRASCRERV